MSPETSVERQLLHCFSLRQAIWLVVGLCLSHSVPSPAVADPLGRNKMWVIDQYFQNDWIPRLALQYWGYQNYLSLLYPYLVENTPY